MLRRRPEIAQRIFQRRAPMIDVRVQLPEADVQCFKLLDQADGKGYAVGQKLSVQIVGVFNAASDSSGQIVAERLQHLHAI